jgi:hypothetical protein
MSSDWYAVIGEGGLFVAFLVFCWLTRNWGK